MRLTEIRGLKFPDAIVTRYFFKERLHEKPGRALELGCGNGNNLRLFREYGWDVTGVDFNPSHIDDAKANFAAMEYCSAPFAFHVADLADGIPAAVTGPFQAVLLANSPCYWPRKSAVICIQQLNGLLTAGGSFFLSTRLIDDYRNGRGREVEPNGFILDTPETGEAGLLNVFYREHELVSMLSEHLGADPGAMTIIHLCYENLLSQVLVRDSHIALWGAR